jgi:hypothetical protein
MAAAWVRFLDPMIIHVRGNASAKNGSFEKFAVDSRCFQLSREGVFMLRRLFTAA